MELSFLFSTILGLFLFLAIIGTISNKTLEDYQKSKFSYFLTIFTSTSIFVLGVLFVHDSWIRYTERNKEKEEKKE